MSAPRVQRATGPWEVRVHEYLAYRRQLGFKLRSTGDELVLFARYLDSIGHSGPLKNDIAIEWARSARGASRQYWATRLAAVRAFASHLYGIDPANEVPPTHALGRRFTRPNPHIYTPAEIRELLGATRHLKPIDKLPPYTYRIFFGLLAVTGMRCGEALRLRRHHVDLKSGRLFIENAKLGKSRVLPLHPSTIAALGEYAARRDSHFPHGVKSDAFFLSRRATELTYQRVTCTFREVRRTLGWTRRWPLPRVHDLRHTFAVRNLIRWCEAGEDVDNKIAALTTCLGHVHVTSTYWYFTAVPELMAIAGQRFFSFVAGGAR
jgi:integrase